MCFGVSKSGSPALKLHTSSPSFFMALAFAEMARVMDGVTLRMREASFMGDRRNLLPAQGE